MTSSLATTIPRAAFGYRFSVAVPDAVLAEFLQECFGSLDVADQADHIHEIVGPDDDGQWRVRVDGQPIESPGSAARALALLLWSVNRAVVTSGRGCVRLHAGAVQFEGCTIVLPGDMEVGKTTLVAGLIRAGADYLSDEAVELGPNGHLAGFSKALSLDPGSWPLFPELEPDVPGELRPWLPPQWQVNPRSYGGEIVRSAGAELILLPKYEPEAPSEVSPALPGGEALKRLSAMVFPTDLNRPRILERLAQLLQVAPCYELTMGSLDAAIGQVRRLARHRVRAQTGTSNLVRTSLDASRVPRTQRTRREAVTAPAPQYRVSPSTTAFGVRDETVLHVGDTDELLSLNPVGEAVWGMVERGLPVGEIVDGLTERFGGTHSEVAAAVDQFVQDLVRRGAVERTRPGTDGTT